MSDIETCPVCGDDYNIQRPHNCQHMIQQDERIAELEAKLTAIKHLVMHHKYDHGRFPYQSFLDVLEDTQ